MRTFFALGIILLFSSETFAKCRKRKDTKVEIRVVACTALDPQKDPTLTEHAMARFFTGVLLEASDKKTYVYHTVKKDPCLDFPQGTKVKKMLILSCCDTGSWGKCKFGGRFLYDIGERPINAYQ